MSDNSAGTHYMKRHVLIALLCAMAIAGCVKNQNGAEQGRVAGDTIQVADSSAQALSAQAMKVLSYEESQGSVLYGKYCAVCHGKDGKGDGFNAFNLDPHPRDFSDSTYMKALSDDQIVQTISGGGRSVNKSPLMPAYGWTLGKQQLRYVASYVRSFMGQ